MTLPAKKRRSKHHVGRLRIACAGILSGCLGFTVLPEEIHPATGAWRTNIRLDVYRWEVNISRSSRSDDPARPMHLGCWESMTDFVRKMRAGGKCFVNEHGEISVDTEGC